MARPKKSLEAAMTLVAKDLLENNQSVADIGTIVGALGEDSLKWLKDLKTECATVDEFLEIATKRADIALIVAAVKCALGYEYQEEDKTYRNILNHRDDTGAPVMKEIVEGRKVKTKRALPNEALLRFILKCRLPEYFQDTQRIEINKKTIEIKELAGKEIEAIGRKFLEVAKETKK
jgi:hypothetical protein